MHSKNTSMLVPMLSDSWEKAHGLSTNKDQGNRDADGVLVVTVKGGGTVTAPVATNISCSVKTASDSATTSSKGKKPASCTTADLVAGAAVHKARTKAGKFTAITLVK